MPTIADQLQELVNQKNQLADNIKEKGVDASRDEKLNTLVPKVLEISTSKGYDTSDATIDNSKVLYGEIAYGANGRLVGTIPTNESKSYTPGKTNQTIPAGYHPSEQTIYGDSDLDGGNIKTGVNIFGVSGTYTSDANAEDSQILDGKTAYVNGRKVTGTIPSKAAETIRPGKTDQTIPAGTYLSGTQTIQGDANLTGANIKAGEKIFGILGTYSGADLSDSTAHDYNIEEGYTAYIENGQLKEGTIKRLTDSELVISPSAEGTNITGPKIIPAGKQLKVNPISGISSEDIRYGSTVLGVNGNFSQADSSEAAVEDNVVAGKVFFVNGEKKTGTMPTVRGTSLTPTTTKVTTEYNKFLEFPYTIPAEPNLISENIKTGVSIFGVNGEFAKALDTDASAIDIVSGKTAIIAGDKVVGSLPSIGSFDYDARAYDQTIEGPKYIPSGKTLTFKKAVVNPEDIAYGKTVYGEDGTFSKTAENEDAASNANVLSGKVFFVNGTRGTGTMKYINQNSSSEITPTTTDQTTTSNGYLRNPFVVKGDTNLVSENIKDGITIFNVKGNYVGLDSLTEATEDAHKYIKTGVVVYGNNGEKIIGDAYTRQPFTATVDGTQHWLQEGYYTGITIPADANLKADNIKDGITIYGTTGNYKGGGGGTEDATATAADILLDKTAYVADGKVTGTIPSQEGHTYTPKYSTKNDSTVLVPAGTYVTGDIKMKNSPELVGTNIKNGVTIFGVLGTFEGEPVSIPEQILFDVPLNETEAEVINQYGNGLVKTITGDNETTNLTNYVYNTISAVKASVSGGYCSGISYKCTSGAFYFTVPINIQTNHLLISTRGFVSTWINPTVYFCFVKADSLDELDEKVHNKQDEYRKMVTISNAYNSYMDEGSYSENKQFTEIRLPADFQLGSYYFVVGIDTDTGGNECVLNRLSIITLDNY